MKKRYSIKNLDCANCAMQVENAISHIDGVKGVSVSFMTEKLAIDIEDGYDASDIKEKAIKVSKSVEPDCEII